MKLKFYIVIKHIFSLIFVFSLLNCNSDGQNRKNILRYQNQKNKDTVNQTNKNIATGEKFNQQTGINKIKYENSHLPLNVIENVFENHHWIKSSLFIDNEIMVHKEKLSPLYSGINFYSFIADGTYFSGFYQESTNVSFSFDDDCFCLFSGYNFEKKRILNLYGTCYEFDPRDGFTNLYDSIGDLKLNQEKKVKYLCSFEKNHHIRKKYGQKITCNCKHTVSNMIREKKFKTEKLSFVSNNTKRDLLIKESFTVIDSLQKKVFPKYLDKKQDEKMKLVYKTGFKLEKYDLYFVNFEAVKGDEIVYFNVLFKGNNVLKVYLSSKQEALSEFMILESPNFIRLRIKGKFSKTLDLDYDGVSDKLVTGNVYYFCKASNTSKAIGYKYEIVN